MTGTGTASTAAGETARGLVILRLLERSITWSRATGIAALRSSRRLKLPGLAAVAQRTPEICGHVWWELETLSGIQCHPDISRSRGMFI